MRLEKEFKAYLKSPIGFIEIISNELAIKRINFIKKGKISSKNDFRKSELLKEAYKQLKNYFSGKKEVFDLPLFVKGTGLQQSVWKEILNIPSGETTTYKNIAKKINRPNAYRAVGNAVGKNPIPIIIPCHRVIHSNGDIKGFSAGNHIKKFLLRHEGII